MGTKRKLLCRLWIEELESRLTPSPTNSINWAGYAVQTNFKSPQSVFTSVSGTWVQPEIATTTSGYSSFWVGLDGYSSGTVEQIGTDSDYVNGVRHYYAWYEMYPKPFVKITTVSINPGDTISASVSYVGANKFNLSISNLTTGASFTTQQTMVGAKRSSAEWIAEAPSAGSVLPLANFGTVKFSNASATISNTIKGPINNSPRWDNNVITMISRPGTPKATPSELSNTTANGVTTSSFAVVWNSSGVTAGRRGRSRNSPLSESTGMSDFGSIGQIHMRNAASPNSIAARAPDPWSFGQPMRYDVLAPLSANQDSVLTTSMAASTWFGLHLPTLDDLNIVREQLFFSCGLVPAHQPALAVAPLLNHTPIETVNLPGDWTVPIADGIVDMPPRTEDSGASVQESQGSIATAMTTTFGKLVGFAGAIAFFAHGALFGGSQGSSANNKSKQRCAENS